VREVKTDLNEKINRKKGGEDREATFLKDEERGPRPVVCWGPGGQLGGNRKKKMLGGKGGDWKERRIRTWEMSPRKELRRRTTTKENS